MSEQDRADLVAYLDGELSGEAARTIEAKISLDPTYRAEADSFKRTWDLLDFLPKSEPTPSFADRTLSKIVPVEQPLIRQRPAAGRSTFPWRRVAIGVSWAAALILALGAGYGGYKFLVPREPGEAELIHDLRLIENKRFYDLVEDFDFLQQLDHPDLFGEDTGG